jgi:hypothetical protein
MLKPKGELLSAQTTSIANAIADILARWYVSPYAGGVLNIGWV